VADFLIIGAGMFGAAAARYLAPHAELTVVGAPAHDARAYGAHYDEGRIIGDHSRDPVWSELNRRAVAGLADLDPALVTSCGAITTDQPAAAGPGTLTLAAARTRFPMLALGPDETISYEPAAGYFSPRRYVALATQSARASGAVFVSGTVRALRIHAAGVEAELVDGRRVSAQAGLVATGAFAAGSDLLPAAVALRAKSEVYVLAELDDRQAAELAAMPCVNRRINYPALEDVYVLPPIRYPDGRTCLKVGANTMTDHWLPDSAAVRAWYDHGSDAGPVPALRQALTDLLPGLRVRAWHTRRCSDAYTATRRPYIDVLEPGRLTVALGGNGRGAQAADAIGRLAADLALTGRWPSDLPRDAFRQVPGAGPWHGLALLAGRTP
jgi:sarcosine oxidase